MPTPDQVQVVVHPTAGSVVAAAAARLVTAILDAQAAGRIASVVLTGGGTGIGVLSALAASAAKDAVDWSKVELWWGDERFVAADSSDRNDKQAREALLDGLPLDPDRVHPFPASDGRFGTDAEAAAQWYADELDRVGGGSVPTFDVLMLGMGGEGHVASIFPGSPAAYDDGIVCAVHDCPKPPPDRLSMTFSTLGNATEVWFLTTGAEKAEAVARAVGGAPRDELPAAGPKGRSRTLWLIDPAAAGDLPSR